MKRRSNAKSTVYAFLRSKGVLENGTHEEIQSTRKEYWNEYKRKWRNEKRRKEKEFTVSLSNDELKLLTLEAKRHKLSRTQFLKQSSFAYINKSFIIPDSLEVRRIAQLLSMTYNSIRELLEENKVSFKIGRDALETIQQLEREILPSLHNPKPIEEFIKHHIVKNPQNKLNMLKLINSL